MDLSEDQRAALDAIGQWLGSRGSRILTLGGHAGTGKALPCDQQCQTPDGPREIGILQVGDLVFGQDGRPTRVTGVFPQGVRQAYRVTFRDGSWVECDIEHLWSVRTPKMRQKNLPPITITLREIMRRGIRFSSGSSRFCVPLCNPVQYEPKDLPVHPYLLGLLIGDGTSLGRTPTLCTPDLDRSLIAIASSLLPEGMRVVENRAPTCPQHRLVDPTQRGNRLTHALRALDLTQKSPMRFVPPIYLQGAEDQRWDLLRGLMDTDGSCVKNRTSFSTTSARLVEDMAHLVQSLGGTAIPKRQKRGEWQINVKMFTCPFSLPRKAKRWSPSSKNPPSRYITNIEPSRTCEHICIKVEKDDGLFLTKDFVVTHNTTLIRAIVEGRTRVKICAYTGKAAYVLRTKGLDATTIHKMIYQPYDVCTQMQKRYEDCTACLRRFEYAGRDLTDEERRMIKKQCSTHTEFEKIPELDAGLVVVDEASMVNGPIFADLLSFGVPLLFVGDHGQLEPIGDNPRLMSQPDIRLEKIHRQAETSPIIRFAHHVRRGNPPQSMGPEALALETSTAPTDIASYDVVLCGKNATRVAINARIRRERGYEGALPEVGERVICLRNNDQRRVFNGMLATVEKIEVDQDGDGVLMTVRDDEGDVYSDLPIAPAQFGSEKTLDHVSRRKTLWDFGYCLTAHKSQGSEWDRVCVLEWIHRDWSAERWRYTAATRAKTELVYCINPNRR